MNMSLVDPQLYVREENPLTQAMNNYNKLVEANEQLNEENKALRIAVEGLNAKIDMLERNVEDYKVRAKQDTAFITTVVTRAHDMGQMMISVITDARNMARTAAIEVSEEEKQQLTDVIKSLEEVNGHG